MLLALWNRLVTLFRPDPISLQPSIDFDVQTGSLNVRVEGTVRGKLVRLSQKAVKTGEGSFQHRRFKLSSDDHKSLLESLAKCQWIDEYNLSCSGSNVPECLDRLRSIPKVKQSQAAASIRVHSKPLESRTYLELDDPETLIVRQNYASSEGHEIPAPDTGPQEQPDWLRVSSDYFKAPREQLRRPQRGRKIAPGKCQLTKDEVPEFLESELPSVRKSSRVLTGPSVSELRVVRTTPDFVAKIDLDEASNQVIIHPQYKSGSALLGHTTLNKYDRSRTYLRKDKTFHRVDWSQVENVSRALKQTGLKEQPDGSYRAPSLNFDEIINVFSRLGVLSETEIFQKFRERLLGFKEIEQLDLPQWVREGVQVRNYQHHGYEWLAFLKQYGLPGILADEMGLGKTLQALLAIAYYRDQYGRCPSMVVCPAALVEKWVDEAEKFLSRFSVFSYSGQRRKDDFKYWFEDVDLMVTSYDTLVRDVEELKTYQWRFLILDEAQRIKNPDTRRAQSVRKIPAEARIAITGTPVENRLRDLWALFDFLAPGYLGSAGEFDRNIAYPIEQRGDRDAQNVLLRKTRPFILRRLKTAVATELPDKIEKTLRCELTNLQRTLYKAVVTRDLEEAIKATGGKKLSLGNPHIFAVLTKLKQICCHPGLVTGEFQEFKQGVSGKFDAFMEIFEEIVEGESSEQDKNKLIVFSQYLHMASFLQDFIISNRRKCDRIDGSVPPSSRPSLCKEFNADPSRFGMVLTLSSGGVGLDLQSANHVVLYDQWWNPAVHSQAIDRVHRIGQERKVLVFNIITRGTLEEKIEAKLSKKKDIFDLAIKPDELLRKEITREELLDLVKLEE